MWTKLFIVVGGLAGCAGVALGAVSAHALADRLDAPALATLDTAAGYLLVHGLLLLTVAALSNAMPTALTLRIAGCFIAIGIVLFCGGLTMAATSLVPAFAGAAPAGGIALMAGWLLLPVAGLKNL